MFKNTDDLANSISEDLRVLWQLLGSQWRRRFWSLMALSLLVSATEVLSIGSLLPFLAVLTDPLQISRWALIAEWFQVVDLNSLHMPNPVLTVLGLAFGLMVLMASLMRWWLFSSCSTYAYQIGNVIGREIFRRALMQPYSFHLQKSSSEVIDVIANRVQMVVGSVLMAGLQLLTSLVMAVAIAGVLLWLNPWLSGVTLIVFALVYVLIYRISRRRLKANSSRMSEVGAKRYQYLQEGLGGIRDIHVNGTYDYFVNEFGRADDVFRTAQSQNIIVSASPRYLVEGLGTLLLVLLALAYTSNELDQDLGMSANANLVSVLGLLILSAQRMLPMLQQIYAGWTSIHGMAHTLHIVRQWIELKVPERAPSVSPIVIAESEASADLAKFNSTIELSNVGFAYQLGLPHVLRNLNLTIKKGQAVGLYGVTGSGKSTLLDILMGLLEPTDGYLIVDGQAFNPGRSESATGTWLEHIAHVPQHVFLADSSIASNVAFGLPTADIARDRIRLAIEQAQISKFIDSLPQGIDTVIGERGVRLSGGQRQRLGIARALYKRARLLVLDEATSALDPETEEAIMQFLVGRDPELTVVMVSHRPSALKHCDVVHRLERGSLVPFRGGW